MKVGADNINFSIKLWHCAAVVYFIFHVLYPAFSSADQQEAQ